MDKKPLRILMAEDNPQDAELILRRLRNAGFEFDYERVDNEADYLRKLDPELDLILSDFAMPQFTGLRALQLLRENNFDIPFILISGTIGEETAVDAMRAGASDYLLKDRLVRLGEAVHRALAQSSLRKDREQAEEVMRQSEHKYRHLFESLSEAAFLIDTQTRRILDVNLSAEKLLGRTRSQILGMNESLLFPTEKAADYCAKLTTLRAKGKNKFENAEVQSKDGRSIFVRVSMSPIQFHGRDLHLLLMADISEQKRAEEKLREQAEMLDHAHDAIIIRRFDNGGIAFWNKGAERLYGWTATEATRDGAGIAVGDPRDLDTITEHLLANDEYRGLLKQFAKDGEELTVEVSATLIRDADGAPRSVLSINNDITQQKKLETQLLRAQRLESIGTLASGVAHDLNNVLTPVLIASESIRHSTVDEDIRASMQLIEESARRGAGIVKQVLTFARGIQGERVMIRPSHLIEEMADIARRTFPKMIEIDPKYSEDLWSIEGDPTQLHQVLLNLSVNARDAMPNGGSLVLAAENFTVDENYASMTPGVSAGPYVVLRVSDTGSGMPRGLVDKIFDPFFTTKEVGKGTGLGLSTALGIIKSHQGMISVYSEPGQGTTFKIFLPAMKRMSDSQPAAAPVDLLRGNGQGVLVVDDEPAVLRVTELILKQNNYAVECAPEAPDAIAILAQRVDDIQVALTDLMLPHMDGVSLIRAMKRIKPDLTFIASTGQGEQARLSELQSLGVKHFLSKPYDSQTLLETVNEALH